MKNRLAITGLTLLLLLLGCSGKAQRPQTDTPQAGNPATAARMIEFQGDEIGLVLRSLARQAGINLVVDNRVTGQITLRLENTTPGEAIKIIADSNNLVLDTKDGVTMVRAKEGSAAAMEAPKEKSFEETISDLLSPAVIGAITKASDSWLEYLTRPETAQKLAKAKKQFYDALITEGFSKDEAFQIIVNDQGFRIPNPGK